jgi:RNA polymerase sigma factor (sigma-70 family)
VAHIHRGRGIVTSKILSTSELIEQAKAGDHDACAQITQAYQNLVFGYAFGMLNDFHLAQDVTQETFFIAFSNLSRLENPDALPAWLRRIAHHRCHRILRRSIPTAFPNDVEFEVEAIAPAPADRLVHREEESAVTYAIAQLPTALRQVVALYYLHGRSQKQIAAFLGVPVTVVNNRLHTARQQLKRRMIHMVAKTFTNNALPDDFAQNIGEVLSVRGPVIEARFRGEMPHILDSLTSSESGWAKVVQRKGDGVVRAVITEDARWKPGVQLANAPEIGHVKPIADDEFEESVRVLAPRTDAPPRIIETGIKVIDLLSPLVAGGSVGILSMQGVGRIVLVQELFHRLEKLPGGISMFCPTRRGDINAVQDMLTIEEGYPGDCVGDVQVFWMINDRATDPDFARETELFDSLIYLTPVRAVQGFWPAIDAVISHGRALDEAVVGREHVEVARRVRETISQARKLMLDAKFFEYLAYHANARAAERLKEFVPRRLSELSVDDRALVERARKLEAFFTQPFYVAEQFSKRPGVSVQLEHTIRSCKAILDGGFDDRREEEFLYIGAA